MTQVSKVVCILLVSDKESMIRSMYTVSLLSLSLRRETKINPFYLLFFYSLIRTLHLSIYHHFTRRFSSFLAILLPLFYTGINFSVQPRYSERPFPCKLVSWTLMISLETPFMRKPVSLLFMFLFLNISRKYFYSFPHLH